jgi:hypothetical protein
MSGISVHFPDVYGNYVGFGIQVKKEKKQGSYKIIFLNLLIFSV